MAFVFTDNNGIIQSNTSFDWLSTSEFSEFLDDDMTFFCGKQNFIDNVLPHISSANSIIEIGGGFGSAAKLIKNANPDAEITIVCNRQEEIDYIGSDFNTIKVDQFTDLDLDQNYDVAVFNQSLMGMRKVVISNIANNVNKIVVSDLVNYHLIDQGETKATDTFIDYEWGWIIRQPEHIDDWITQAGYTISNSFYSSSDVLSQTINEWSTNISNTFASTPAANGVGVPISSAGNNSILFEKEDLRTLILILNDEMDERQQEHDQIRLYTIIGEK